MAKVITIAQQKGGAGKTTIAAHLAVALKQRGLRVAAIDIDPQGSLTQWHKIREERFGEGYTGLTFAALSGWRVGSELARLRKSHDAIIIDSPPHTETDTRTAIRYADLIVIPVQPSPTDLWATKATVEMARSEKIPYMVVMNRVAPNSKLAETIMKELNDGQLAAEHLGNRVLFASSLMEGRCVTETSPKSPASDDVKQLAAAVMTIAELTEQPAEEDEREGEFA